MTNFNRIDDIYQVEDNDTSYQTINIYDLYKFQNISISYICANIEHRSIKTSLKRFILRT